MARAGRVLANEYDANPDLVVAGALLHDIGKLDELDYGTTTSYTREGNLVGHVTLGALMVRDACDAIPGFPDALRDRDYASRTISTPSVTWPTRFPSRV